MRTMLTIDDDILAAARELAVEGGRSLGGEISDLAGRGLTVPLVEASFGARMTSNSPKNDAWTAFPDPEGPPATTVMMEAILDEIDQEDMRVASSPKGTAGKRK